MYGRARGAGGCPLPGPASHALSSSLPPTGETRRRTVKGLRPGTAGARRAGLQPSILTTAPMPHQHVAPVTADECGTRAPSPVPPEASSLPLHPLGGARILSLVSRGLEPVCLPWMGLYVGLRAGAGATWLSSTSRSASDPAVWPWGLVGLGHPPSAWTGVAAFRGLGEHGRKPYVQHPGWGSACPHTELFPVPVSVLM